jgi:ABC-type multidrug transport system fused ATPase/permease subunit
VLSLGICLTIPYAAIAIVLSVYLIYILQNVFRSANRELKRLASINDGKLLTILGEVCSGTLILRAFERQNFVIKDYLARLNDQMKSWELTKTLALWIEGRLLLVGNLIFTIVAIAVIIILAIDADFDYSNVSFALTYAMVIATAFTELVNLFCFVEQRFISVERIRQYLE